MSGRRERLLRVLAAVSAAAGTASLLAFAMAGLRAAPVVAIDEARADPRRAVRLEGGVWQCDAVVPASERLTVDDVAWIPRAGDRRLILVASVEPVSCPPAEGEAGVLAPVLERSYERLRDRDPVRFGPLAQHEVLLFFARVPPRQDRGLLYAGVALVLVSFALLGRSRARA